MLTLPLFQILVYTTPSGQKGKDKLKLVFGQHQLDHSLGRSRSGGRVMPLETLDFLRSSV